MKSDGVAVKIAFADSTQLEVDFAFDARGFPKSFDSNHMQMSLIPTNAALIRRGPVVDFQSATRSVARPYGWIFIIPLTTHTSYGYVYNSSINSRSEIETELGEFMLKEGVNAIGEDKHLHFPNFTCNDFFDGSLFKIGNTASFLEPLEATAIGVTMAQIHYASLYPIKYLSELNGSRREKFDEDKLKAFNKFLLNTVWKIVLFVSWHYASGSCFGTEFWHFAKSNFDRESAKVENEDLLHEFKRYLKAGSKFDYWMYFTEPRSTFAGLTAASFYEVGNGIGYFS